MATTKARPGEIEKASRTPGIAPRIGPTYGIASVNEWANCVQAGAQCLALRRNPHPEEQDLNVPRCLFDGSGIDAFQGLSFEDRVQFLGRALRGTAPNRRQWNEIITTGRKDGLYEEVIGSVTA